MDMRGTGFSAHRLQTGGPQRSAAEDVAFDSITSTQQPVFRRAVVVDVFNDPVTLTDEQLEQLTESVTNPDIVRRMKRNCITARQITGDIDRLNSRPSIFFPLLDPYVSVPIKPGEQVLVIFEDPAIGADIGYWLCRVPEPIDVDDVNYTHGDRRYADVAAERDAIDRLRTPTGDAAVPGFPNGAPDEGSLTIGGPDEYEQIVNASSAYAQFQPEAVPRFTKRPADLVLQGSNNTLISLGTTRSSAATSAADIGPDRGTIDIVSGRGQDVATAANTVENTRGDVEVDKAPEVRGVNDVVSEGDPDYVTDRARIMISSNVIIDELFDINVSNGGEANENEQSAVAMRADCVRLSARDDVKIQAGDNGTGAMIVLRANGDILLIPGPSGVVKVGGEDAAHAPLVNNAVATGGRVSGLPILSSMGGVVGTPSEGDPHGSFSTKVLLKG